MALHYSVGFDVLQACFVDHEVLQIVAQSQSSLSRSGEGFKNTHIGARILAVADAYDRLITTPQEDGTAPSPAACLERLRQEAGSAFDPVVVEAAALAFPR